MGQACSTQHEQSPSQSDYHESQTPGGSFMMIPATLAQPYPIIEQSNESNSQIFEQRKESIYPCKKIKLWQSQESSIDGRASVNYEQQSSEDDDMDIGYVRQSKNGKQFREEYLSPTRVRSKYSLEMKMLKTNDGKNDNSDSSSDMLEEFDSEDINELEVDIRKNRKKDEYTFEDTIHVRKIQATFKQKVQRRKYLKDIILISKLQARVKGMLERRRYAKAKQSIIRMQATIKAILQLKKYRKIIAQQRIEREEEANRLRSSMDNKMYNFLNKRLMQTYYINKSKRSRAFMKIYINMIQQRQYEKDEFIRDFQEKIRIQNLQLTTELDEKQRQLQMIEVAIHTEKRSKEMLLEEHNCTLEKQNEICQTLEVKRMENKELLQTLQKNRELESHKQQYEQELLQIKEENQELQKQLAENNEVKLQLEYEKEHEKQFKVEVFEMIGNMKNNMNDSKDFQSSQQNLSQCTDDLEVENFKSKPLKDCSREQRISNMIKKSPSIRTQSARDDQFKKSINSKLASRERQFSQNSEINNKLKESVQKRVSYKQGEYKLNSYNIDEPEKLRTSSKQKSEPTFQLQTKQIKQGRKNRGKDSKPRYETPFSSPVKFESTDNEQGNDILNIVLDKQ